MLTNVERDWLDYAWRVVTCPAEHRAACIDAGGAVPGPGRVDGNELRWPGYVGRRWKPGYGVLCVGAVHREPDPAKDKDPILIRTTREITEATRAWQSRRRSLRGDEAYLRAIQAAYVDGLPTWDRWKNRFRSLVEDYDYLGMTREEIAWANLAKCRVSLDRNPDKVFRLCQRRFIPIADLVAVLRPAAVLCCVLNANSGGEIVESWDRPEWSPLVFTWQGRNGTDRRRRRLSEWGPQAIEMIRARQGR